MQHENSVTIRRYDSSLRSQWDEFVLSSKNGHFMFLRDYMDYHADRFEDHSLVFEEKSKIVAVLPANASGGELCSHGGLTFGGILFTERMGAAGMISVVAALKAYIGQHLFSRMIYKAIPSIYSVIPSDEDLYALFVHGARLFRRDLSTAIRISDRGRYASSTKAKLKIASRSGLAVGLSEDYEGFWGLLTEVLMERHGKKPVHSLDEILLLKKRFPESIRLCEARSSVGQLLAGCVLYVNRGVVHTQYMANSVEGRDLGALDAVIDFAIRESVEARYFDFGISTTESGRVLNDGLQFQKERFGGRGVVHDFYELTREC